MTAGNRLEDKVAIVTGAGTRGPMPGTGQATAVLFARHGARVLLVDLDIQRAEETLAIIEREGGQASVASRPDTSTLPLWPTSLRSCANCGAKLAHWVPRGMPGTWHGPPSSWPVTNRAGSRGWCCPLMRACWLRRPWLCWTTCVDAIKQTPGASSGKGQL